MIQMNNMQELLKTLADGVQALQAENSRTAPKYNEMLQHQQQVSDYITHLNEFLKLDERAALGHDMKSGELLTPSA